MYFYIPDPYSYIVPLIPVHYNTKFTKGSSLVYNVLLLDSDHIQCYSLKDVEAAKIMSIISDEAGSDDDIRKDDSPKQ